LDGIIIKICYNKLLLKTGKEIMVYFIYVLLKIYITVIEIGYVTKARNMAAVILKV